MKNSKWLLLAGLVIMMMTIGCEKQMGSVAPEEGDVGIVATSTLPIQYNPGGSWFTYFHYMPTVAAPGMEYAMSVGNDDGGTGCNVRVWNNATNLYVQYNTLNGWKLSQVHVAVATTHDGIPHNKQGSMQPGQFPYPLNKEFDVDPPETQHLVTIPWESSWNNPAEPGLFMVAHSIVFWVDPVTGDTTWQTGCGSDTTPDDPHKTLTLPNDSCYMTGVYNHTRSYWLITLTGTGADAPGQGQDVWDGDWLGWCSNSTVLWVDKPTPTSVWLWNALDPALPDEYRYADYPTNLIPIHWDRIGYLVTKYSGDNWLPEYGDTDLQRVIWYECGRIPKDDLNTPRQVLWAEDADLNGNGWLPHAGDWVPVICAHTPGPGGRPPVQPLFIEVDP